MHQGNITNIKMLDRVQTELDEAGIDASAFIAWTGRIAGAIGVDGDFDDFNSICKLLVDIKAESSAVVFMNTDDPLVPNCPVIEYEI